MYQEFAELLTIALKQIKRSEGKKIALIQDELGYELGRDSGGSTIEYWRKGHRPAQLEDLENLARLLQRRTNFDRSWFEEFLTHGGHPYPAMFCDHLFEPQASSHLTTPRMRLPVRDFVGRKPELLAAEEGLNTTQLVVIRGMGGIGKTEFACALTLQVAEQYLDGQMLVHVHGTSETPLTTSEIVRQILQAFYRNQQLPTEPSTLLALYHSLLEQKHLLIVLDDVADPEQIEDLVAPTQSAFIITTRRRWNIPGATYLDLEILSMSSSIQLAHTICPHLHTYAQQLVQYCDQLPLAIRVSAAFLASDESYPVNDYLQQLADEQMRLRLLQDPQEALAPVAASLHLSMRSLSQEAQQALGALSILHSSFDQAAALALVDLPNARSVLSQLRRNHLLNYDAASQRYSLHTLVKALAHMYIYDEYNVWLRAARHFIAQATAYEERYDQGGEHVLEALTGFDLDRPHFDQIWEWLGEQEPAPETDQLIVRFIRSTVSIADLRYDIATEQVPHLQAGLAAARRLKDRHAERVCVINLGRAYMLLNQREQAIECYYKGLELARADQLPRIEANALDNLGQLYLVSCEFEQAEECLLQAVELSRRINDHFGQAASLNNLGVLAHRRGQLAAGQYYLEASLSIQETIGYERGKAWTRSYLALLCSDQDNHATAQALVEAGLDVAQELGDGMVEAQLWLFAGIIAWRQQQAETALQMWLKARQLAQDSHYPDMFAWAHGRLAIYYAAQGEYQKAQELYQQRLDLAPPTNDWEVAVDQRDLGRLLAENAQYEQALPLLEAWDTYQVRVQHCDYVDDHQFLEEVR